MEITIEKLEVFARHGVTPEERATGGRYVVDVSLSLEECRAAHTDDLEDTIDYGAVTAVVIDTITHHQFRLLERLATAVAEEILAAFAVDRVRVRVAKPAPPLDAVVAAAAVTTELARMRT